MRYLGSKQKLLSAIDEIINKYGIKGETFADLFAGTGCVGDYFKDRYKIISNDFLYYSFVMNKARLENAFIPEFGKFDKKYKCKIFDWLNNLKFVPDDSYFIYNNYTPKAGRMFFTEENGIRLDGIRLKIEELYRDAVISEQEYFFLLASMVESMTKVSNTSGTYEAYFKFWDPRAQKRFEIQPLEMSQNTMHAKNEKYNMYADFITDCMAYIIDYTIKFFACFISLPRTMQKNSGFNYLENIEFVLCRLYETRRSIHKDISKKLIDNMILFFKQYKMNCMGGNLHIKVNYFNFVWEDAVNQYLNAYFKKFDQKTNSIVFDLKQKHSAVKFKKVSYLVDESGNRFEIELDHYGIEGKKLYIFDSKYYQYLKALNYKQYAYDEILRYSKPEIDELYSVLLLPGVKPAGIHFELKKEFQGNRKFGNIITEQYLCVKDVLQHYIQT